MKKNKLAIFMLFILQQASLLTMDVEPQVTPYSLHATQPEQTASTSEPADQFFKINIELAEQCKRLLKIVPSILFDGAHNSLWVNSNIYEKCPTNLSLMRAAWIQELLGIIYRLQQPPHEYTHEITLYALSSTSNFLAELGAGIPSNLLSLAKNYNPYLNKNVFLADAEKLTNAITNALKELESFIPIDKTAKLLNPYYYTALSADYRPQAKKLPPALYFAMIKTPLSKPLPTFHADSAYQQAKQFFKL